MAEVVKKKDNNKYNIDFENKKNTTKSKKVSTKKKTEKNNKSNKSENKSLWTKFMIFCHGVKSEVKKVHWTNKKDLVKYSIATILFIIFGAAFFYLIDFLFALVQSLVG